MTIGMLLIVAGGAVSYRQLRPRTGLAPVAGGAEMVEGQDVRSET